MPGILGHFQPVHDDFDGVLFHFVEFRKGIDLDNLAVHAQPHKALRAEFFDHVDMFTLAVNHHGRQQHQPGSFREAEDGVDHLRNRLRCQRQLVFGAIRGAGAREQEAQVVVNFGHGTDG